MINQQLQVNSAMPGLPIQYSMDDGLTWSDVRDGIPVGERVVLGTRCVYSAPASFCNRPFHVTLSTTSLLILQLPFLLFSITFLP